MKKTLIWLILISPLFLEAQDHGIVFEHHLSWKEIFQKAKAENKYVFVDCYTSWCGPCKWMDKNVYGNDSVGSLVNKEFISVKVQLDSTQHDDADIKRWYTTAREIDKEYRISAYPSYLFFSPDGGLVHKGIGAMDIHGFTALTKTAMDSSQQFYTLLFQYQNGAKDYVVMPYLANTARKLREDSLAALIAKNYLRYLEGFSDEALWTKDHLVFIGIYEPNIHYDDIIFHRYFGAKKKIDSVMNDPGYAEQLINFVVFNDEVGPGVNEGEKKSFEPNWHRMERLISKKYGKVYAKKSVLDGKASYYQECKNWEMYASCFVQQVRAANVINWEPGARTSLALNNNAFQVFKYSNDKKELKEVLSWVDLALSMESPIRAQEMDTKANILYKLGRKNEAINLEAQSHHLAPKDKDIEDNFNKMEKGLPTWD